MKNILFLETLADIAYLAGQQNFYSGDSRADIYKFIDWAYLFEKENKSTDWDNNDYIISIEDFTSNKIRESIEIVYVPI